MNNLIKKNIIHEIFVIMTIAALSMLFSMYHDYLEQQIKALKNDYGSIYEFELEDGRLFQIPARDDQQLKARVDKLLDATGSDSPEEEIRMYIEDNYANDISSVIERNETAKIADLIHSLFIFLVYMAYPIYLVMRLCVWRFKVFERNHARKARKV